MEHKVCFLYKIGQELWYVHKTKQVPKHGYVCEIKIHITSKGFTLNTAYLYIYILFLFKIKEKNNNNSKN